MDAIFKGASGRTQDGAPDDRDAGTRSRRLCQGEISVGISLLWPQVADLVAELFAKMLGNDCWPELIPFLCHQIMQRSNEKLTEMSLQILSEISPVLPDSMEHSLQQFPLMMQPCLSSLVPSIRLAALKAVKSFALVRTLLS